MLKIEVVKPVVRQIKSAAGKLFRVQTLWVHAVDRDGEPEPFPTKIDAFLDDDQAAYPAGVYTLHPSAVYVDRSGRLAISPRLAPVVKKAEAAAR